MKKYFSREFVFANKNKIICAFIAIALIISGLVYYSDNGDNRGDEVTLETSGSVREQVQSGDDSVTEDVIIADVSGAVNDPKVVELKPGDRINDAIEAAGGLKPSADISAINRAAPVKDGDKIFVPEKGEVPEQRISSGNGDDRSGSGSSPGISNGKVNINTADSAELQTLSGVGPAIAEKIIDYRNKSGNFRKIEDIKNVNGIGEKTFDKMKENISV